MVQSKPFFGERAAWHVPFYILGAILPLSEVAHRTSARGIRLKSTHVEILGHHMVDGGKYRGRFNDGSYTTAIAESFLRCALESHCEWAKK